ncbi:MAG TPA: pullulanase-type alpha-1,6-glucosidase [Bryobacteraceae bacterium]|jgi:pullulanase|nr:pullulanase-type alpha-1,6-glucosidase [Bryobacteraceae bacterium]
MKEGFARIHYFRVDGKFDNWSVYSFGDTAEPTDNYNAGPAFAAGMDDFGAYFDIRLKADARELGFIVHNVATGEKDPGPDQRLDVSRGREAWIVSGDATVYTAKPEPDSLVAGGLAKLRAFWVDRATVAIPPESFQANGSYRLVRSAEGSLRVSDSWRLEGADAEAALVPYAPGFNQQQRERFPQLETYAVLRVTGAPVTPEFLKGQIAVGGADRDGRIRWVSGIQQAGVLDDLCFYDGSLGLAFEASDVIAVRLWAPTAVSVEMLLFDEEAAAVPKETRAMRQENGAWVARIERSWTGKYYLFRVRVYVPGERRIVENIVSDPYSVDLALNGAKSRITDLRDASTKPAGWDAHRPPALRTVRDFCIYELHVRDFSANDASVDERYRGTYLAFTDGETRGMQHLRRLAQAGLKAIHLLPTFHFSSVKEDKATWKSPGDLSAFAPDSEEQQARIAAVQKEDAYNWGYDPVHYFAPQGSYAFDPRQRVKEYRQMVQALHGAGLRVVQDLVFNHTVASGQAKFSVLDKIVPGYYHRLDPDGNVESYSCCNDTASEHRMMERLMVDAIVQSAREYKIDGFRFDLMGLHFVSNLERVAEALRALTLGRDGVDGSEIYLYGEGWEMGSVAWGGRGENAGQRNLYGTGIGSFNDRIRDAVRGGNPFSEQRLQGLATGLFTHSSSFTEQTQAREDQLALLLQQTDWIKIGLAGNLRDFEFVCRTGERVQAREVIYNGQPAGYAATPSEIVNYCSVHDNQTLFDAIQIKSAAEETIAERARRQVLAMSLIVLGQGIPFFQAGDDLLRSKDMDENSFDSGDWFNRLDFSYQTNNWGFGLPLAKDNARNWPLMRPLLADPALRVTAREITYAREAFRTLFEIRESSRLFRMETLDEIQRNLQFLNNGPGQIPGLIVMRLDAHGGDYGPFARMLVVFNARIEAVVYQDASLAGVEFALHPAQAAASDPVVRTASYDAASGVVSVPALTTAVFAK